MKQFWLALAVLLCNLSQAGGETHYAPSEVDMEAVQISEHTYFVQGAAGAATFNNGFVSNAGFVITEQHVVVIDALGTPSLGWDLLQHIRAITDKPIAAVIMTHYHSDHAFGLQVFKDLGAEIIAPVGAMEWLDLPSTHQRLDERKFLLDPWVNDDTRLITPDRIVTGNETLNIDGTLIDLTFLGDAHSEGDLSVYIRSEGVLFSGDIIFEGRVPYVGDANTKHWLETLRDLETGKVKVLAPGHGGIAADPNSAIRLTRRYVEFLRQQMQGAVENMIDFDSAYQQVDWQEFEQLPAFEEANRRNAYQVYLNLEQELF